jgi:hypothetical protein
VSTTVAYLLQQTKEVRGPKADTLLLLDDTLCAPVGSLCDYVDRHDNHGDATYPLAHHPVTRHYVSGPVRFPLARRLYRRDEELTPWEAFVHKPFPARPLPTTKQARGRLHKEVDAVVLDAATFQHWHQQCRTKSDWGLERLAAARRHQVPLRVRWFDSGYLAAELVAMARSDQKDWGSLRKKHRNLETHSFIRKDAVGNPVPLAGPHIAVEDLIPLIPPPAYRPVSVGDKTSWTVTLAVRLPGLGKVRLGRSCAQAALTGTAAIVVTNRVEWSAQRLIALYWQRWPIEIPQPHYGSRESLSLAAA